MALGILIIITIICCFFESKSIAMTAYFAKQSDNTSAQLRAIHIIREIQSAAKAGASVENADRVHDCIRQAVQLDLNANHNPHDKTNVVDLFERK